MTVPIIGRRAITPTEAVVDFLARRVENNQTNASRDNAIAALILVVEAMARKSLKDDPEALAQAQAHMDAALGGAKDEPVSAPVEPEASTDA